MKNKLEKLRDKYNNDVKFFDLVNTLRAGIVDKFYCLKDLKDAIKYLELLIRFGLR